MSPDTCSESLCAYLHHSSDDADLLVGPTGHLRGVGERNGLRHDGSVVAIARRRRAAAPRPTQATWCHAVQQRPCPILLHTP